MLGKIKSYTKKDNLLSIEFENGTASVTVVTATIINFFSPYLAQRRVSKAIENLQTSSTPFSIDADADQLTIRTEKLKIVVSTDFKTDIYDVLGNPLCEDYRGDGQPFVRRGSSAQLEIASQEGHKIDEQASGEKIKIFKKMTENTYFYGLGDKTGHLNKKDYHYRMWNTDNPNPHVESFEAMYKTIPFFIALRSQQAFGIFFDNSFESTFDFGKENSDYYAFSAKDGDLDYYFIYGPSMKTVIGGYTYLTGRTPLPQLWTLGYQQSRWAYTPENRLHEIADTFRQKDIPCDVIHLDIDYMDGYRVFTWDKKKFADPTRTLTDLRKQGFKVVTIIDPAVKKDKGYTIYDEGLKNNYFATDKDGIPYVNQVWPGDALYPDFANKIVRHWWSKNQKIMTDTGVSGIWNDMNEPASFNGPLPDDVHFNNDGISADHREIHNVYGHYMSKATYEGLKEATGKRPFVITRAAYAGTQKYATVWTGDNQSLWEHLRMSLPMLMNLGLSGITFCGTDVGGFGFDCTAELLSRWVQVGAFTPLFRNHSSIFTRDQEPWAFDEQTEAINRKYIKLRYQLLPYLYDILHEEESNGLPMMRPLLLGYQSDEATYEINDEFLCGDQILVAPIVEQGLTSRMLYLPKGDHWIDYWTKEVFAGGQYIIKKAPIDVCPIFVREGSVIPLYPVQNYVGEKDVKQLTLSIYPFARSGQTNYEHYQDDGESFNYRSGVYNLYDFSLKQVNEHELKMTLKRPHAEYDHAYHSFKFILNRINDPKIIVDGQITPFDAVGEQLTFQADDPKEIHISY